MRPLDWAVLCASLLFILAYGLWKGRGSDTMNRYLLAGKTMPWYAMALSIMATQASAITFISTTSQGYVDGMRFVQFYFGLPIAMVILSATAVPIFHRTNVYTAYEYLEKRFDAKTRALVTSIFLIGRGLGVGVALSAPAVVLTVILAVPEWMTTVIMGGLVVTYTVFGGIKAVTWTDFQQMLIMFAGIFAALITAIFLLPGRVSFVDALWLAGAAGRLNPVTTQFSWSDQFNLWSGLIGGAFLALAYFGTDQSQVQRYLTGRSIAQSRLSLLFNAVAKVPMQFLILFTGAMVFVFFTYERPPVVFQPVALKRIQSESPERYREVEQRFGAAFDARRQAADGVLAARRTRDPDAQARSVDEYRRAQRDVDAARADGARLAGGVNDVNYIFLTFVTRYMPAGIVGLVMAAIFAAAMSTISAEVNSLATVSVIDVYRRHIRKNASDRHYLRASRVATALWGCYAVGFAQYGRRLGSLIVAVNAVGSLFYGGMLGAFVLAFFFPRVRGNAAFAGVLAGEAAIFYAYFRTSVSFLWYNVIGCVIVIAMALVVSAFEKPAGIAPPAGVES